jgi:hypothetical protein
MNHHRVLDNGAHIRTFAPPPGGSAFDPLTASADDLALHGFPARPENPELLARFQSHFNRVKGRLRYIEPIFSVRPSLRMRPSAGPEGVAGPGSTNIWSGAVVYAPSGQSFRWVQAEWVVSNASAPVPGNAYTCICWVGLGNSSLCQAGTGCSVSQNGVPSFFLFHEWTPPGWVTINNLAVNAGDLIAVVICTPSGAGSTSATIFFSNTTTGYSTSYAISIPPGTNFLGDQAEWIVERPIIGGGPAQLPDYGQVFFSSANSGLAAGGVVNAGAVGGKNGPVNMVVNGATLSTGAVLGQTVVQCQYVSSEPHGNQSGLISV